MKDPKLNFKPLFYILDKCKGIALAAEKQDKYEVSGKYVKYTKKAWKIWPANLNNQLVNEFPTRFEITKDEQEAWFFCAAMSAGSSIPQDLCLELYPRAEDFPKY